MAAAAAAASAAAAVGESDAMRRWFAVADLSRALHGFLVFEVSWRDVHGINYLNELLTDTSLALEARYMKKWEFYSAEQAAGCTHLWFLGRATEARALRGANRLQGRNAELGRSSGPQSSLGHCETRAAAKSSSGQMTRAATRHRQTRFEASPAR